MKTQTIKATERTLLIGMVRAIISTVLICSNLKAQAIGADISGDTAYENDFKAVMACIRVLPSKRAEFAGNKKRNEAAAAKVEMPLKMGFKYG